MAKRAKTDASEAKIVVYTRIDPRTITALDEIREGMRPQPSRAQLIDAALAEYVERHGKGERKS